MHDAGIIEATGRPTPRASLAKIVANLQRTYALLRS